MIIEETLAACANDLDAISYALPWANGAQIAKLLKQKRICQQEINRLAPVPTCELSDESLIAELLG